MPYSIFVEALDCTITEDGLYALVSLSPDVILPFTEETTSSAGSSGSSRSVARRYCWRQSGLPTESALTEDNKVVRGKCATRTCTGQLRLAPRPGNMFCGAFDSVPDLVPKRNGGAIREGV